MSNPEFGSIPQNQVQQLMMLRNRVILKQQPLPTERYLQRQPKVKAFDEEIKQLGYTLTSFWIFIHSFQGKPEGQQQMEDYRQFRKMYKSDFLRQYFFVNWKVASTKIVQFTRKLDINVKLYVLADLLREESSLNSIITLLRHQNIDRVVFRNKLSRQNQSEKLQEQFLNILRQSDLQEKYGGIVYNVNEAIEIDKKIFSFLTNAMKPNYLILNNAKNLNKQNPNDDSDILINTKAYLKESLDLKQKQMVMKAFSDFKSIIYKQFQFKLKTGILSRQNLNKQKKYLNQFFEEIQKIIQQSYPFSDQTLKQHFFTKIISSYSEQTSIYQTVNNLCKRITSKQSFMKISFYCKFLNEGIKYLGIPKVPVQRYRDSTLYRCAIYNKVQWNLINSLSQQETTYIMNLAFKSTSFSRQVSQKFGKKNNANQLKVLAQITISPLFWKYYNHEKCKHYLEYCIDMNFQVLSSKQQEEQVLFNCFNVFKVIKCLETEQEQKEKSKIDAILYLEAFSHLEILQKKINKKQLTQKQKQILDVILRVEEEKDYVQILKEQGKQNKIVNYLQKIVESGVDLSVSQSDHYMRVLAERGQQQCFDKFIGKVQQKFQKTVEQQVKIAIKDSILQQKLESQHRLSLAQTKLDKKSHRNWAENIELLRMRLMLAEAKESNGSFDQTFDIIKQSVENQLPNLMQLQLIENIETWLHFLQFLRKHFQKYSELYEQYSYLKLTILQKEENLGKLIQDLKDMKQARKNEQKSASSLFIIIKSVDMEELISVFLLSKQKIKELYDEQILRTQLQNCKRLYYQRIYLKVKFLMLEYATLVRSEKIEKSKQNGEKTKNSEQIKNLFTNYFETHQQLFEKLYRITQIQTSKKLQYQRYLFLIQIFKFLNGLSLFFPPDPMKEKKRNSIVPKQIIIQARQILKSISQDHYDLTSLKAQQIEAIKQKFLSEKINKFTLMRSRIKRSDLNIEPELPLEQILQKKQQMNMLESQNEETYRRLQLPLSIMKSQTSRLSIIHQTSCDHRLSEKQKQQLANQFESLSNKIRSTLNNQFLARHTVHAYHIFLKASFYYHSKEYEQAIYFLQQCEEIYEEKLNNTIQRMESESNQAKKLELLNKINKSRQSNEVRIKMEILRANICINYKSKLYKKCQQKLEGIYKFIEEQLLNTNSFLPQILYYKVYLQFLNQGHGSVQQLKQALEIVLPVSHRLFDERNNKLKYLRYYTLYYLIAKDEREKAQKQIQIILKFNSKKGNQILDREVAARLQNESIYKIEKYGWKKLGLSVVSSVEHNFNTKYPNISLKALYQSYKTIFTSQSEQFWKTLSNFVQQQLLLNISIANPTLITLSFLYSQNLISSGTIEDYRNGMQIIENISWQLKQILNKNKKIFERHLNNNCAVCLEEQKLIPNRESIDKIKNIVLAMEQYRVQVADDAKKKQERWSKNYCRSSLETFKQYYFREKTQKEKKNQNRKKE